jgi:hypothetical protein
MKKKSLSLLYLLILCFASVQLICAKTDVVTCKAKPKSICFIVELPDEGKEAHIYGVRIRPR